MVYASVWKDTYYTTTASTFNYTITDENNNTIFAGRAQKMPGQENIRININKVCQDYLWQELDAILGGGNLESQNGAIRQFHLKNQTGGTEETYSFLLCYDYDFNWTGQTGVTLSQPIDERLISGMTALTTRIIAGRVVTTTASAPTKTTCGDYGLYYLNRRGGWDAFAIQGTGVKSEAITQYLTDKAFDNNTREFEANRYLAEIKTSYVLNTHYLSDEQAENLAKNLLSSNFVYLHCLKTGEIKPVIITDTSVTYQTYQTNGKKMAQYKIAVTESQSKLRR